MKLAELKKSLHEKIDQCSDEDLLQSIVYMLAYKDKMFVTPEQMKEGIRQGREDIRNGRILTMEDFEKKYEEYLK